MITRRAALSIAALPSAIAAEKAVYRIGVTNNTRGA